MTLTPDAIEFWSWGPVHLNATILLSWVVMGLLAGLSFLVTRRLTTGPDLSPGQNLLEVLVQGMESQIEAVAGAKGRELLPFVGTLFLFIFAANVLSVVPGFVPPTGSFSTTAGLAICVFVAVPWFGIKERGLGGYLQQYIKPTPLMLPFNVIGEISRTFALAVRLFGNVMSGTMIVAILLVIAPLVFPVLMQALGLLTGVVQAYIFAVLATVYIASATPAHDRPESEEEGEVVHG